MISKTLKIAFVALIATLNVACSNDDDTPEEAPLTIISGRVGESNFRTDLAAGVLSNDGKLLIITATNEQGNEILTLTVGSLGSEASAVSEEPYPIDASANAVISYTVAGLTYRSSADGGGTINLNSFDTVNNTIFGSFTGTLFNVEEPDSSIEARGSINALIYTEQ